VEAVTGRRPVGQLARWLAPGVFQALRARAGLTARTPRTATVRASRGAVVRRVLGNALGPHTYEACAVVDDGTRVRAVGLRLESHRGAWRVTELDLA
ncbi:Rv3235 family protein, partial [Cellulomonas massiliensis]|uniref:Rv3235 family protein n=1 Tax=Cellulomonas massiliensis TaxID=1465811 RepID=UPI00047446C3